MSKSRQPNAAQPDLGLSDPTQPDDLPTAVPPVSSAEPGQRRTAALAPARRHVVLFTDGACSGNPGPGGWAFILRDVKTKKELTGSGGDYETTNNRMEMQAVIEGLKSAQEELPSQSLLRQQLRPARLAELDARLEEKGLEPHGGWPQETGKERRALARVGRFNGPAQRYIPPCQRPQWPSRERALRHHGRRRQPKIPLVPSPLRCHPPTVALPF